MNELLTEQTKEKIITDMCDMIKCRTVSNLDDSLVDWSEFDKFKKLLKDRFPTIYANCEYKEIGKIGIMHKIKGTDGNESHGCVLMAHFDVVPVDEEKWTFPPFAGDIVDGNIRGRGALDTKGTLCACMESVELKLKSGWKPKENLYLCFSGEEETNGDTCSVIVDYFRDNNITIDFVLDEGGAVVNDAFPGVTKKVAMIGTAEKGSTYYDVIIETKPGHASAPPKNTAVALAGEVISAIHKDQYKAQFTTPVKNMLKVMGKQNNNPALKFLFSNLWLTKGLVEKVSKIIGGELYAMIHTTCALTKMEASKSYNVLPNQAKIGMNYRLLGTDTVESSLAHLEKIAKKTVGKRGKISVAQTRSYAASKVSDTKCDQWKNLCSAVTKTWPDVIPSEYLMMACSDSRHYCRITDKIYRFSAMFMSKAQRGMIHGNDEQVPVESMIEAVDFYINVLENL